MDEKRRIMAYLQKLHSDEKIFQFITYEKKSSYSKGYQRGLKAAKKKARR